VFAPRTRILIALGILLTVALGLALHHAQNSRSAPGGAISVPKLLWLVHATLVWLFICPALAADGSTPKGFRLLYGVFAGLMWARAPVELYLLYVAKSWRPPMGMAHDLICAGVVLVLLGRARDRRADGWHVAFAVSLVLGVLVECVYAGLFERAVSGATTGPGGLWFADPHDPRFAAINALTTAFNLPFFAFLVLFLLVGFGVLRRPR
jgi:hypothetical protein